MPAGLYGMMQVKEDGDNYGRHSSDGDNYGRHSSDGDKHARVLKHIPLEQLMDLKVDYAFKQLFGNEKNKDITVVFLNAILQKTGRNQIRDISFDNTEITGEYVADKQSRLDLLVVTEAEEWINVEIQFTNQYDMVKRSLYYWSKTYTRPFGKGMAYTELRPVIAINILNFSLFEGIEDFHTSYHLYEDERRVKLTNVMELHFIEMSKLIKDWKQDRLNPWNSALAKWLLLLGVVDHRNGKVYDDIYHELEAIAMTDESLREMFKNWEELSMTWEQRLEYDARMKQIMDEEALKRQHELWRQERVQKEQEEAQREMEIERRKQETEQREQDVEQRKQETEQREREVEQRKQETERERQEAVQEKRNAEQEKQKAEQEKQKAEQEKQKAEQEKQDVEREKQDAGREKEDAEQRIQEAAQKERSTKEAIARNLLKEGLALETVADATGLSESDVTAIQREMSG